METFEALRDGIEKAQKAISDFICMKDVPEKYKEYGKKWLKGLEQQRRFANEVSDQYLGGRGKSVASPQTPQRPPPPTRAPAAPRGLPPTPAKAPPPPPGKAKLEKRQR